MFGNTDRPGAYLSPVWTHEVTCFRRMTCAVTDPTSPSDVIRGTEMPNLGFKPKPK